MLAIRTQQLARHFGPVRAVDGVDVQVERGEIFGFLGPNGSGKTTTIRMLTGRLRPTSGHIEVLGHAIPAERDAIYPRVAVVGESKDLYERLTGRENLNLFADLRGVARARVDGVLERFALTDRAKDAVRGYSQGMRQRLLLARAFLADPDLLFLDEPTRGLDPASARALRDAIRQVNGQGCTVFLTTHLMEEAEQLCHRVGLIAQGKLVAQGTPAALRAAHGQRTLQLTTAAGQARLALDDIEVALSFALLFTGVFVVPLSLAEEREKGHFEALLLAGTSVRTLLAGKAAFGLLMTTLVSTLLVGLTSGPLTVLPALLHLFPAALCFVALGLATALLVQTRKQAELAAALVMMVVAVPAFAAQGSPGMAAVAHAFPLAPLSAGLRATLEGRGQPASAWALELGILFGYAALGFAVAAWRARRLAH